MLLTGSGCLGGRASQRHWRSFQVAFGASWRYIERRTQGEHRNPPRLLARCTALTGSPPGSPPTAWNAEPPESPAGLHRCLGTVQVGSKGEAAQGGAAPSFGAGVEVAEEGEMSPTDGEAYEAIAFLKNCLVRTVQKCAEFEILPLPGVGIRDELAVLDQYLTAHGLEPMKGIAEFSESYREQQPAALIHFSLAADSPQECLRSCVKNAEILGTVLALQRGAYPTVIGAIVINHQLGRYWWWVRKPTRPTPARSATR